MHSYVSTWSHIWVIHSFFSLFCSDIIRNGTAFTILWELCYLEICAPGLAQLRGPNFGEQLTAQLVKATLFNVCLTYPRIINIPLHYCLFIFDLDPNPSKE